MNAEMKEPTMQLDEMKREAENMKERKRDETNQSQKASIWMSYAPTTITITKQPLQQRKQK